MPARMEGGGGYISEGGQLKSKNGQKYVVNSPKTDGYYVSKGCVAVLALATILAMILVALLTYFLVNTSCESYNNNSSSRANGNNDSHVATAKILGSSPSNGYELQQERQPKKLTEDNYNNKSNEEDDYAVVSKTEATTLVSSSSTTPVNPIVVLIDATTTAKAIKDQEIEDELEEEEEEDEAKKNELIFQHKGWNPTNYKIKIMPLVETNSNNGSVDITLEQDSHVKSIQPIALDINGMDVGRIQVRQITSDNQDEAVDVNFKNSIKNEGKLLQIDVNKFDLVAREKIILLVSIDFISRISDTLQGIYRVNYTDDYNAANEWLISTQFSPIDARRAFPCIDQPDKKAEFEVTVISPKNMSVVLSNMPYLMQEELEGGLTVHTFDKTPRMSTYLVAFLISNLKEAKHSYSSSDKGPKISIWARREVTDMTEHAFNVTTQVLPFLENYFNIKYKLPKLDLVAVPDFGYGAMENWGLITFRESALLVPDDKARRSSSSHTERVTNIIAHELAHQWFGNLVTMEWWPGLWLKEGFATYMANVATQDLYPDWRVMEGMAVSEFISAMGKDSDAWSHPISSEVRTTSDIRQLFDPISYSKGAVIIRMMNGFLGEPAFKFAVKTYLKRYEFGNSVQDGLWELMTRFGHQFNTLPQNLTVKEIMDSWTLQAGYPVLDVKKIGSDIHITQQRFLLPKSDENDTTRWFIPITYSTNSHPATSEIPKYWMSPEDDVLILPNVVETDEIFYLNVNRSAYYRINYDLDLLKPLSRYFNTLPEVIQAQLIDDSMFLARAEMVSYDVPLMFLMRMGENPKSHFAWKAAMIGLSYLGEMTKREPIYDGFRAVMKQIVQPSFDNIGFDEQDHENHIDLLQRARIVELACEYGYDRCTNRAQMLFREWMRTPKQNNIKPNLKELVYCTALKEGGVPEWRFAYSQYLETTVASERETLLSALGCTLKPFLLSKYLNITLSPGIRKQDGSRAFSSVARNMVGFELASDFLMSNIDEISTYFGDGFSTLSKMIESLTTFMNKPSHLEQMRAFALKARKLKLNGTIKKTIKLAIEQIKNNIYWRSRSYYNLETFLKKLMDDLNFNYY